MTISDLAEASKVVQCVRGTQSIIQEEEEEGPYYTTTLYFGYINIIGKLKFWYNYFSNFNNEWCALPVVIN